MEGLSTFPASAKGIYALEALLGLIIVFVSLSFFLGHSPSAGFGDAKERAFDCLAFLDNSGSLRPKALSMDAKGIDALLSPCLPSSIKHHTRICASLNCTAKYQGSGETAGIEYFIYGQRLDFSPAEIEVKIWRP